MIYFTFFLLLNIRNWLSSPYSLEYHVKELIKYCYHRDRNEVEELEQKLSNLDFNQYELACFLMKLNSIDFQFNCINPKRKNKTDIFYQVKTHCCHFIIFILHYIGEKNQTESIINFLRGNFSSSRTFNSIYKGLKHNYEEKNRTCKSKIATFWGKHNTCTWRMRVWEHQQKYEI